MISLITWAAFEFAFQRGHYQWRSDPMIEPTRQLFLEKIGADSIYSAFSAMKDRLNADPLFMADEAILNEDYFRYAVRETQQASWVLMAPGDLSSIYDLKAFLSGRGEKGWVWKMPTGKNNMGAESPNIIIS